MTLQRRITLLFASGALCTGLSLPAIAQSESFNLEQYLPPSSQVVKAITNSQTYRIGSEQAKISKLEGSLLKEGNYEWESSLGYRQRTDRTTTSRQNSNDYEIGLAKTVRLPGKAKLDHEAAENKITQGQILSRQAWADSTRQFLELWKDCSIAASRKVVHDAFSLEASKFAEAQDKRYKLGEISLVEQQQATLYAKRMLAQAQLAALEAEHSLNRLVKLYPAFQSDDGPDACYSSQNSRVSQLPESPPMDAWQKLLVENSPAWRLDKLNADYQQNRYRRSKQNTLADPTIGLMFAREQSNQEQIVGVSLSLPIGGPNRSLQSSIALSQSEQAQRQAEKSLVYAELQAAEQVETYNLMRKQATLASDEAALAIDLAEKMAKAYAFNEIGHTELQLAKQQAFESRLAQINSTIEAMNAYASIKLQMGDMELPAGN